MSDGSDVPPGGGAPGAPGGGGKREPSAHPEAVRARKKRARRALRKALEAAPIQARPATPTADKMATTRLAEAGIIRRKRMGRMYEVEQMMLRGAPTHSIIRRICADFGCSEDQVFDDMKRLKPEIARAMDEAVRIPAELRREQDRAVLVDLYERCIADGDKATARRAYQDICRIDGAFAPIRVDVTVRPVIDAEAIASANRLVELMRRADGRVVDAQATERTDAPVRVLPAPEEMH